MNATIRIQKFSRQPLTPLGARKPRRYYFRLVAGNNEIVAQSEAYNSAQARNKTVKLLLSAVIVEG